MSTMYYTYPDKQKVGQTHNTGGRNYHFTWAMYPDRFAMHILSYAIVDSNIVFKVKCFVDEYNHILSFGAFRDIVNNARTVSFDERIE